MTDVQLADESEEPEETRKSDENVQDVKGAKIDVGGDILGFEGIKNITYHFFGNNISGSAIGSDAKVKTEVRKELNSARKELLERIDKYFDIVAETLYENSSLQDESMKRLQDAKEILRKNEGDDLAWTLSLAQYEVRRVHVAIAKEQQLQRNESQLRWIVPILVLVYVVIVILLVIFGGSAWTTTTEIPIIGIPLSVILWSVIGSIAAMLYRFYTSRKTKTPDEIRWLIARPIIGIIMGALSYLAIISGLFIFGSTVGATPDPSTIRPQLLWVVSFLGGFSDKFFESIINFAVGKIPNQKQEA